MSKLSASPAAYSDVRTVLDLALEKPGLTYVLKTYGAAINFRQRCHRYIKILREQEEERTGFVPGFRAELLYDTLAIKQLDASGAPSNKGCTLRFEVREVGGQLIDPTTGEEIHLPNLHPTIEEKG